MTRPKEEPGRLDTQTNQTDRPDRRERQTNRKTEETDRQIDRQTD